MCVCVCYRCWIWSASKGMDSIVLIFIYLLSDYEAFNYLRGFNLKWFVSVCVYVRVCAYVCFVMKNELRSLPCVYACGFSVEAKVRLINYVSIFFLLDWKCQRRRGRREECGHGEARRPCATEWANIEFVMTYTNTHKFNVFNKNHSIRMGMLCVLNVLPSKCFGNLYWCADGISVPMTKP